MPFALRSHGNHLDEWICLTTTDIATSRPTTRVATLANPVALLQCSPTQVERKEGSRAFVHDYTGWVTDL
jgi:hypothetical protein